MSLYARLIAAGLLAVLLAGIGWKLHHSGYVAGKAEVQTAWDASVSQQRAEAIKEQEANAIETERRLKAQQENDRVQAIYLASARADAARNRAAADGLREQNAAAARRWAEALAHPATGAECMAAGAAILVCADVLGRADRRAGDLAEFADASRAAGLQCAADYGALTPP